MTETIAFQSAVNLKLPKADVREVISEEWASTDFILLHVPAMKHLWPYLQMITASIISKQLKNEW